MFNIPIPKIQGARAMAIGIASGSIPTANKKDIKMQKITAVVDIQGVPTSESDEDVEMEEIAHVDVLEGASVRAAVETASTPTSEENLKAAPAEIM
jgi:hypothetical protein